MGKILNVRIDDLSQKQILAKIDEFLKTKDFHQICTVNPEFIIEAKKNSRFLAILNQSDLNIADGIGLQFAANFLGQRIGQRLTGVDLAWELVKKAAENNQSIYLVGGKASAAEIAAKRFKLLYRDLHIAGINSDQIDINDDNTDLINDIKNTRPDILLVALGAPKQELFIDKYRDQLPAKIALGIGGALDYIAGIESYPPKWIRLIGLEWLYRLITQPQRAKRIFNAVIKFPLLVLKSKFTK